VKCHDKPNRNAPFLRWISCCVTVTLRQKKDKHILTRWQKHFNATCCMLTRKLLMMHWHQCGEVKQVTILWEAWMTLLLYWIFITSDLIVISISVRWPIWLYNYRIGKVSVVIILCNMWYSEVDSSVDPLISKTQNRCYWQLSRYLINSVSILYQNWKVISKHCRCMAVRFINFSFKQLHLNYKITPKTYITLT